MSNSAGMPGLTCETFAGTRWNPFRASIVDCCDVGFCFQGVRNGMFRRWRRIDQPGLELARIAIEKHGVTVASTLVDGGEEPFSLRYIWTLDPNWSTRGLRIEHMDGDDRWLTIERVGPALARARPPALPLPEGAELPTPAAARGMVPAGAVPAAVNPVEAAADGATLMGASCNPAPILVRDTDGSSG